MDSCIRLACHGSCRGKVRCAHCGNLVCPNDVDEDGLCDRCEEVKENDNEKEQEWCGKVRKDCAVS